jgi:hypothetical protein
MHGSAAVLTEVGLSQKMRAALLAKVNAACRPSSGISELTNCTVTVEARLLSPSGKGAFFTLSETGAGATSEQAISRAVELLSERHPEILDGV